MSKKIKLHELWANCLLRQVDSGICCHFLMQHGSGNNNKSSFAETTGKQTGWPTSRQTDRQTAAPTWSSARPD